MEKVNIKKQIIKKILTAKTEAKEIINLLKNVENTSGLKISIDKTIDKIPIKKFSSVAKYFKAENKIKYCKSDHGNYYHICLGYNNSGDTQDYFTSIWLMSEREEIKEKSEDYDPFFGKKNEDNEPN